MIVREGKELPDTFQGYQTVDLLRTWDEIKGDGTKAPEDQISAMRKLIAKFRLGIFGTYDKIISTKKNS
jgi:hypothetical protein